MKKIVYLIMFTIITLAFIALAAFLSVWTECYHYLWFLTIPILGYLSFEYPKDEAKVIYEYKTKENAEGTVEEEIKINTDAGEWICPTVDEVMGKGEEE